MCAKGIVLGFGALALLAAPAVEVDGIAAQVDSRIILKSEIYGEMKRLGPESPTYEEIRREMIDRQLILKAAGEVKLSLQDWIIENRIREIIKKGFDGDRNRLMEMLRRQKVPYTEWRQRIKDDMIVAAMRWQYVDKTIAISPSEMRAEYMKHPERYVAGHKTTVSVILLKPEDASKRAEVAKALKTESFADVARRYSADAHAAEGGLWKDVDPATAFKQEVCDEIAKLPKATLSHWIDLDGWSFLVRKDADTASRQQTFVEASDAIEARLKDETAARLHAAWMERLRAASYVKVFD